MNEIQYQRKLTKKIHELLPGCVILRNDSRYVQGVPDILILYNDRWAMLEIKLSNSSSLQPNQGYYVEAFHEMSFASFINPENEEDVLHDLQCAFGLIREARIS